MTQKFSNAARSPLMASILAGDTSLTVDAALADLFPVADTGTDPVPTVGKDYFKVVLQDSSANLEIVYVRTRGLGAATFTNVIRGQEGTTARAYTAGDIVGLRLTAEDYENALELSADATVAGKAILNAATAAAQLLILAPGIQAQTHTAFTTAGTATAYTLVTSPIAAALAAGQRYRVKPHAANTSQTPTLARDGLTAKSIKVYNSAGAKVNPEVGALAANMLFDLEYDGTDYVVLNPLPPRGIRVDVASVAGTVDLTTNAANTDDIRITGTNAITAFTVVAGRVLRVTASAAFTLTNNSAIVTNSGANIVMAAGDTFILRATAADTVEVLFLVRAIGATTAEIKTGTDATKFIAADKLLAALGFSSTHLSSAITIAQAGGSSYAHGLAREPVLFQVTLTCTSNDGNFASGKRLVMPAVYASGVSVHGMSITFDATNVYYKFVNATTIYFVPDPGSGDAFTLNNSKWQAYIQVWA